jgi:hypothetical protein
MLKTTLKDLLALLSLIIGLAYLVALVCWLMAIGVLWVASNWA